MADVGPGRVNISLFGNAALVVFYSGQIQGTIIIIVNAWIIFKFDLNCCFTWTWNWKFPPGHNMTSIFFPFKWRQTLVVFFTHIDIFYRNYLNVWHDKKWWLWHLWHPSLWTHLHSFKCKKIRGISTYALYSDWRLSFGSYIRRNACKMFTIE